MNKKSLQLIIVFAAALAFALLGIGNPGLDADEAASWWAAGLSWHDFWQLVSNQDLNFAPFYIFMHFWSTVSSDVWWLRLPSAVCAAAAVTALSGFARSLYHPSAGWISAFLLVLSSGWVKYAQDARPYAASLAAATLATWYFHSRLDRRLSRPQIFLYLGLATALPLTHLFAGLVLGVHVLMAFLRRRRGHLILALSALAPTAAVAAATFMQVGQVSWLTKLGPVDAARDMLSTFGGAWYCLVGALAVTGLTLDFLGAKRTRTMPPKALWLGLWWLAPPLIFWTASMLATPIFTGRYVIWTLPPMVISASFAISRLFALPSLRIAVPACLIILGLLTIPTQVQVRSEDGHNWAPQQLAAIITSEANVNTDALFAPGWAVRLPVLYHLSSSHLTEPLVRSSGQSTGHFEPQLVDRVDFANKLRPYARVWVLSRAGEENVRLEGFCVSNSWHAKFDIATLSLEARC
ncbi:mannosyltransferase [Sinomonas atrocyanea]|uniref:glycosyltransferase family 39 protein n=1 Tax=Sinomonas atrocyanea TaxID=37927 RepID=UPI0027822542|nr:glycosyltransferase family 39 protein [Sinomonas atrocyanea]MDP9883356.1 mannosyltransferase [Sinomonas atrocyanea]